MKITPKFRLAMLFVGVSFILVSALLVYNGQKAIKQVNNYSKESLPELSVLQQIKFTINECVINVFTQSKEIDVDEFQSKVFQMIEEMHEMEGVDDEFEKASDNQVQEIKWLEEFGNQFDALLLSLKTYESKRLIGVPLEQGGMAVQKEWITLSSLLDARINDEIEEFNHNYEEAQSIVDSNWIQGLILSIFGLVILLIISMLFRRLVISPISNLNQIVDSIIVSGEMKEMHSDRKDEVGGLTNSFNHLIGKLDKSLESEKYSNTELSEVNKSLFERNKELEELNTQILKQKTLIEEQNKDLRGFAHAVSHDLKTPLRGMASLSKWLNDEYYDDLDKQGQKYLTLLNERSKRLFHLVNGILQYSQNADLEFRKKEEVDLNSLMTNIIELISPSTDVEINYKKDLPVIYSSKYGLEQILTNLITNAINYNDKAIAIVKIKFKETSKWYRFSVSDNGPGIDPKHHDQIFELFKTLGIMGRDLQLGTGIGLAIVKNIVTKLGGKVKVESTVNEGSKFSFTVSKGQL